MTREKQMEFWFAIGSTYTYLTVMRIQEVATQNGIDVVWIPFNVRAVMQDTNNLPFPDSKPAKKAYMWRDLERRAHRYELPIRLPISYPLKNFDLANHLAVVAATQGWCSDYARLTYEAWFQQGFEAGTLENLEQIARRLGRDAQTLLRASKQSEIHEIYTDNTQKARQHGIFGAPSFRVNGELFWGDDRLEDACRWCLGPLGK